MRCSSQPNNGACFGLIWGTYSGCEIRSLFAVSLGARGLLMGRLRVVVMEEKASPEMARGLGKLAAGSISLEPAGIRFRVFWVFCSSLHLA